MGTKDSKEIISVPAGFHTDFASIPRLFWMFLPPDGEYTQAAVLHDFMCETKRRSKFRTSQIFKEAMLVLGVKKWVANLMFIAGQWFGPDW